jgi:hypothetical protein
VAFFNLEDYETVEERLVKFWADNKQGRVFTRLLESSANRFIVEAAIFRSYEDSQPWATGLAEETVQGRGVNATSALENCETSAIGRALANAGYATKGKRASREEMSKVAAKNVAQTAIADAKAKMAQTATEYVPVPKEDDPWTIRDAAPAATVDEAVAMVKDIIGGQTERDIPKCSKCQDPKEMQWKTGVSAKNKKPWGNFSCFACKDVIWYEIKPNGSWGVQERKW